MNVLSVDLGTANTVAVLATDEAPPHTIEFDGAPKLPCGVYADEQAGRLIVGRPAQSRARHDPSRYEPSPKRRIDDGTILLGDAIISVTHLLAAVLHEVIGEAVARLDGRAPDELRLTHPDQWNAARRDVLASAARLAGLPTDPVLIPESHAAAEHLTTSGDRPHPGQAIAVYDFGAGSLRCRVLGATDNGLVTLAEDAITDLGGLAIDKALLEYLGRTVSHHDPGHWQRLLRPESVADRIAQRELRDNVRMAKEKLSTQRLATVPMPAPFTDVDLNRIELDGLIRPSLLRSTELLESTIARAGLVPANLLGVYLIGGASRMPLVSKLIGEHTTLRVITADQPDTAIAHGAVDAATNTAATPADFHPDPLPTPPPSWPSTTPATSQPVPVRPAAWPTEAPPSASQPISPPTGGYPNFPPSGGFRPDTGSVAGQNFPPSGPVPTNGQHPATPGYPPSRQDSPQRPRRDTTTPGHRRRTPLLVGVCAAVVIAVVVGGFVWFGNSSTPPVASCQPGNTPDAQGFTPCMRQLAGSVPQHARCAPGTGGIDIGIATTGATVVTCELPGAGSAAYRITYTQANSRTGSPTGSQTGANLSAASIMEILLPPDPRALVRADWTGNNLSGSYQTSVVGRTGVLVFSVHGSSTIGILTAEEANITPDQLTDYFQRNVQPGT